MENRIIELEVGKLLPNPNNPRKKLGDITELTESIKASGIMQNLTVIQGDPDEDRYMVLIGHRRLAAAKAAGLQTVPCKIIENMPVSEQIGIMLLENIQRNDLTIPEQAQSFQMMLDLGDTVEGIAEKTGFAKSTIYHRVNIAKLDQDVLENKLKGKNYQLTLNDLIALEQVSSIETRNKILEEAYDATDIARRALSAANEENRSRKEKIAADKLQSIGVNPLPDAEKQNRWSSRWNTVSNIKLDSDISEQINELKGKLDENGNYDELPTYYVRWPYMDNVSILTDCDDMPEAEDDGPSEEELARRARDENKKKIKNRESRLQEERDEFLRGIVTGKIPDAHSHQMMESIWFRIIRYSVNVDLDDIIGFCFPDADKPGEKEERETLNLSPSLQMLIALNIDCNWFNLVNWDGTYNEKAGQELGALYACLDEYGFKTSREDDEIIYGSSSWYEEPEEKKTTGETT